MNETLTLLSKVLPQLAVISAVCGFVGWYVRGLSSKPASATVAKTPAASEKAQNQDRARNLEATLEKSKAAHKAVKAELDQLKSHSVSQEAFEKISAELEAAHKAVEAETRRFSALEPELKKAQDAVKNLNARANEADKTQKDRSFALENELSKTREQLTLLQNLPDDSADLRAEIERLRESVATTTRFAGELRKREAAAIEAMEKAEGRLANAVETGRDLPTPSKKIGPVGDSSRITAAKAEVLRLVEQNKQRAAIQETSIPVAETPAAAEEEITPPVEVPTVADEVPSMPDAAPITPDEVAAAPDEAPTASEEIATAPVEAPAPPVEVASSSQKKPIATGDLFALD